LAHLRISDVEIASDLVPRGGADIIISMEPLESLRYTECLAPSGMLVSAADPLVNIGGYPEMPAIIAAIKSFPLWRFIQAAALAKEAGLARAVNTVMVGAASPFLPLQAKTLEYTIDAMFAHKEPAIAASNTKAFRLGRQAAESFDGEVSV
jgi:indolepyruvate ferredoxin oxidoreductase beta subunit